jgi:hypothetical protein
LGTSDLDEGRRRRKAATRGETGAEAAEDATEVTDSDSEGSERSLDLASSHSSDDDETSTRRSHRSAHHAANGQYIYTYTCILPMLYPRKGRRDISDIPPRHTHFTQMTYIHTYHSRFIPEGAAEASQIFVRDAHVLLKLFSYE